MDFPEATWPDNKIMRLSINVPPFAHASDVSFPEFHLAQPWLRAGLSENEASIYHSSSVSDINHHLPSRAKANQKSTILPLSPNPPKDTDGRREDRRRGMRELQGRWPGLDWGRWEVGGGSSVTAQAPNGRLRELGCAGWQ